MRFTTRPMARRLAAALSGALLLPLLTYAPAATAEETAVEPAGPRVVAADGTVQSITAINPSSRAAGLFALYTSEFGSSTKTNDFGAEAVLQETDTAGTYKVLDVCTVFDDCPNPGDNAIPEDGVVLSASPGGDPDVRLFLRDHVNDGDLITIEDLTTRTVTGSIDATDPTAETNPDGVDPASGECFPGCRGAEQLIVYTPASGRSSTGTNEFGFEVTVTDGVVTGRGGADRAIPENGVVISGHGGRGAWLSSNAVLGAKVTIDGEKLTITVDESTYIYGAEQALARAGEAITAAQESCLQSNIPGAVEAVTSARSLLDQARAASEAGNVEEAVALAEQSRASGETAWYRTAESRPVEGRGVWVRPEETTPAQIEATLDRISASGFNMVFLETVWQGYTIFPSEVAADYGIAPQRPNMVGFDPLEIWIQEAHERNMELHPWVHTFFVGSEPANGGPGPVLSEYPQWAAVEREDVGKEGPQPASQEVGYYFADPAMPEPREYIKSVFEEILTKYDVDGLHLDYIRYPVSLPWDTASFSYSDYSRAAFEADHGIDPYLLTPQDALWETWNLWREEQVTSFVAEVREMQRSVAPDLHVSAAVFPDPSDGLAKKFQNWAAWVEKGYVDILTGMSFGTSAESVAAETALMREAVGDNNLLYTATYGPFRGSTPDILLEQTQAVRDANSDGAALFAYNQISDAQADALREGVFRTPASTPHADLISAARTAGRWTAENLEAASGHCMPPQDAKRAVKDLDAAERWLRVGKPDRAVQAYQDAAKVLSGSDGINAAFSERVVRDLNMYSRWVLQSVQ